MTSYLSRLSPVPGFPDYTGPYKVGTIDVELPVSELDSPSPSPDDSIATVQYRIFYPCEPESKGKNVSWIPSPQRGYVSAYTRFLGAGSMMAEVISFFPRLLHYISIPALKDSPLLAPPTSTSRWPVMIFSHGLGGSRNAYSHLIGSIASHGMIVIAPEHRDGSTPISYIRSIPSAPSTRDEKTRSRKHKKTVGYFRLSHTPSPEVEEGRNAQLKVRLWELGLIHDSLVKLDQGKNLTNLNTSSASLSAFIEKMDVHTPGKITFAGHSFGAATITQFVKSTFYSSLTSTAPSSYTPLFTPSSRSPILAQITPKTPVILLDVWCLPLRAESTRWLWNFPFPCYCTNFPPTASSPSINSNATFPAPGGKALLAIESQAFYLWIVHLNATKRLLSPTPSLDSPPPPSPTTTPPNFYYAATSAHLSQSDFGILFPWFTKRFLAVEEPERILRLNVRAVLQLLRNNDVEISATSHEDQEIEDPSATATSNDETIFSSSSIPVDSAVGEGQGKGIRGWHFIPTTILDSPDSSSGSDSDSSSGSGATTDEVSKEQRKLGKAERKQKKFAKKNMVKAMQEIEEPVGSRSDKEADRDIVVGNELVKNREGTAEKL